MPGVKKMAKFMGEGELPTRRPGLPIEDDRTDVSVRRRDQGALQTF